MNPIWLNAVRVSGASLDPDALTLIAAMTVAPNAARRQVISDHIVALKAAGIWALLDAYWMLAAHDEQASRLNWKSPGDFTLAPAGVIAFTTDRGWQGNGSSGYLDTGWLAACGAEPPAPLPEIAPQVAPEHVVWLPVVTTPKVEPVRGWARAYSNLSDAELERLGIGWYYDYALRYPFPKRGNVEYVPFLWCDIYPSLAYGKPTIRYFDALQKLPADYGGYLLFLNEPDLQGSTIDGGQCERTPDKALTCSKRRGSFALGVSSSGRP
jgi:hypothetical protein